MRTEISREGHALVVRMPAPRALGQALIAVSWVPFLAACVAALVIGIRAFGALTAEQGSRGVATGVFFIGFALFLVTACLAGFAGSLYGLLGNEVARLEGHTLTLERVLFGARTRQRYDGVSGLRLAKPSAEKRGRFTSPPPKLLFDADGQTHGFGAGVPEDEAEAVLAALKDVLREEPLG